MKKVLIVGAYGFIGRNVAKEFKERGFYVIGIGRGNWPEAERLKYGIDSWLEVDIEGSSFINISETPDIVIHCAGVTSVRDNEKREFIYAKTVDTTKIVLEYMKRCKIKRLVFISSAAVYGNNENDFISENAILDPISLYGKSKVQSEELCRSYYEKHNINIAIVRLFSVYGVGLNKQLIYDTCSKLLSSEDEATFIGTGEEIRDFIHISDVATLVYTVVTTDFKFEVFNGGVGKGMTVADVVSIISKFIGGSKSILFDSSLLTNISIKKSVSSNKKLLALGWEPKKDILEGLQEYVRWFLDIRSAS